MKTLSIAFSMILLSVVTAAQTRYDVGILAIPSFSNFHTGGETEHYQFIPLLNYGLRGNLNMNKFAFSTGLLHLTQGTKFEVLHTTPDQPDEPGEYYDFIIRVKAIVLPLNVDYMFLTGSNTELSGGLGLYSGYIYSQQTENTSIPKNYEPEPGLVYPYPRHRFNDVEIFNVYYFGFNAGIGVRQFLSPKASLQIRPNYLFQIRQKLQADPYYWTERLMSFSLDIGFYYRLGANVE